MTKNERYKKLLEVFNIIKLYVMEWLVNLYNVKY